jgi:hypothetical protein
MLRARKVVAYVAERIEADLIPMNESKDQPDTWLELLCQEKVCSISHAILITRLCLQNGRCKLSGHRCGDKGGIFYLLTD